MNSTINSGPMRRYSQLKEQEIRELSWFYYILTDVPAELKDLAENWFKRRDTDVAPLIDHLRAESERAASIWKGEGKAAYEAELNAAKGVWRRVLVYVNAQQRRPLSDMMWLDKWPAEDFGPSAMILKRKPGRRKRDVTPTMEEVVEVANMLTEDCDPRYRLERDKGVAFPVPQKLREAISRHFDGIGKKIGPTRVKEVLEDAEWRLPRGLQ